MKYDVAYAERGNTGKQLVVAHAHHTANEYRKTVGGEDVWMCLWQDTDDFREVRQPSQ